MNGKASNLKHERIEDLRGITLGGTSIVARFITATHVINYKGAKPSIIFTEEKHPHKEYIRQNPVKIKTKKRFIKNPIINKNLKDFL